MVVISGSKLRWATVLVLVLQVQNLEMLFGNSVFILSTISDIMDQRTFVRRLRFISKNGIPSYRLRLRGGVFSEVQSLDSFCTIKHTSLGSSYLSSTVIDHRHRRLRGRRPSEISAGRFRYAGAGQCLRAPRWLSYLLRALAADESTLSRSG